jgi:hypothetical protein
MLDFKSFNIYEALSNSKGKSSLGLLLGLVYGIASIILYGVATYMVLKSINGYDDVYMYAGILTTASGTLVGTRYWKKDKEIDIKTEITE